MNGNSFNKHMGKKQFLTKGSFVRAIEFWVMERREYHHLCHRKKNKKALIAVQWNTKMIILNWWKAIATKEKQLAG